MTARSAPSSRLRLDMPVMYLKGVGPSRAEALNKLGILTAGDLLYHIPHRYEDASTVAPIASLEPGMQGTVIGRVISKGVIPTRKGLRIFQAVLRDDTGMMEVSWPGQPFLDRTINKGDVLLVTGSIAEAMAGRSRLAFEELFFVQLLQLRAKELARERRAGITFTNKRDLTS